MYSLRIVASRGPVLGDTDISSPLSCTEVVDPSVSIDRPWRHVKGGKEEEEGVEHKINLVSLTSTAVFDSKPLLDTLTDTLGTTSSAIGLPVLWWGWMLTVAVDITTVRRLSKDATGSTGELGGDSLPASRKADLGGAEASDAVTPVEKLLAKTFNICIIG